MMTQQLEMESSFADYGAHIGVTAAREAIVQGLADGTSPQGLPAALTLEHASMKLFLYEPKGTDHQTPHDQDEVYIVLRGSGVLLSGSDAADLVATPFGAGDSIFIPAGMVHRFEHFSDDLSVWVIMYGPEGGEVQV